MSNSAIVDFYRSQYFTIHINTYYTNKCIRSQRLIQRSQMFVWWIIYFARSCELKIHLPFAGCNRDDTILKKLKYDLVRLCHAWNVKIGVVHSDDIIIPESLVVVSFFVDFAWRIFMSTLLFVLFWFDSFGETEHTLVLFSLNSTVLTCGQLNCRSSIFLSLVSINNNNFW